MCLLLIVKAQNHKPRRNFQIGLVQISGSLQNNGTVALDSLRIFNNFFDQPTP